MRPSQFVIHGSSPRCGYFVFCIFLFYFQRTRSYSLQYAGNYNIMIDNGLADFAY